MAQDRFQPHTPLGMRLLAHELAHVVQQGNPVRDITSAGAISQTDEPSELQADRIAAAAGGPGPRAAVAPGPVPVAVSAPLIARQADAGVPDEEARDAGAPEAGAADAGRAEALNDPMYPLQAGCVAEQGGCQQYLSAGTPDPDRFRAEYNDRCRGRTKYRGPDVWPSDPECEQAKNGTILDPGKLREFKELLLEYKVRLDAGQLPPDAVSAGDAAVRAGLQALQRAGLTEEAITAAARNPPDPQVVEAFAPAAPGIIMRVVIQGGKLALVSEPAAATAATVTGGEAVVTAATTTTVVGGEAAVTAATTTTVVGGEAVGAGAAAAAGTAAVAVAGAVLIGLVLVGLGILIVWALLQPGMRLDPVAPKLLDESLGQLRDAVRRQRQPQPAPQAQPEPKTQAPPHTQAEKQGRKKTCATEYPDVPLCDSLPQGYTYRSAQAALAALKVRTGNPSLRLVSDAPSTSGPCPGTGRHYGVKSGGEYIASISCCPCCQDSPTGPVLLTRCRII
jgi:hypothetical protein